MPVRRVTVPKDVPPKLDKFLAKAVPNLSIERARALLSQGLVKVNGKVAAPNRRLWGGEEVELHLPDAPEVQKVDGQAIEVLHETAQWLVVNKPAGLVVEPESGQVSVLELVATQRGPFHVGGAALPGVVHRLDKQTSGCLMFAKTDDGKHALEVAFEEKRIEKTYWALVLGTPPPSGRCDTPYARDPANPRKYTTQVESPRRARLSFRTLDGFDGTAALVEVSLETGRTHQIRVQLSELGFPVLGDPIYGPKAARAHPAALRLGRLALHAASLKVGDAQPIKASAPDDFAAAVALLGSSR